MISGSKKLQTVTNHPVHIINGEGYSSPTALIPFCDFYGDMSTMGNKIDTFDVPFCNSFKAKIVRDQLCYTMDPNLYKDKMDLKGKLYVSLFIDYNEERQFQKISNEETFVIINTIGISLFKSLII